jgi:hypothetical protein
MPKLFPRTPPRPKDWLHEKLSPTPKDGNTYQRDWEPRLAIRPTLAHPISQACTADQIYLVKYRQWVEEMKQPYVVHRKQWEWVYILQSLAVHGMLADGKRGLGFGVGTEPIAAVAAKRGAHILATDSSIDDADEGGWIETNQHATDASASNADGICDAERFNSHVSFRVVDMREVPDDITGYDFTWSACAFEHLGTIDAGLGFVERSLDCLKPGGVAVHTTEYNVSSNDKTIESGQTVLYRRRDFEEFAQRMRAAGHRIQLTFGLGTTEDDRHIDEYPYSNCHLKVRYDGFVITSFGLTIQKAK